jgi:WD40 repeat protein
VATETERHEPLLLATASEDQTARIWDVRRRRCVQVLDGHTDEVLRLAWAPNGKLLATAGADGKALIWRRGDEVGAPWRRVVSMEHPSGAAGSAQLYGCTIVRGGRRLLTAGDDKLVEWDIATGQKVGDGWRTRALGLPGHGGHARNPENTADIFAIAAGDGAGDTTALLVAQAMGDGSVRVQDLRTPARAATVLQCPTEACGAVTGCAFSSKEGEAAALLAACTLGGSAVVWDTRTWQPRGTFECDGGGPLFGCRFWPSITKHGDNPLITWSSNGTLYRIDPTNANELGRRVLQNFPVYDVAFSADGYAVAAAGGLPSPTNATWVWQLRSAHGPTEMSPCATAMRAGSPLVGRSEKRKRA